MAHEWPVNCNIWRKGCSIWAELEEMTTLQLEGDEVGALQRHRPSNLPCLAEPSTNESLCLPPGGQLPNLRSIICNFQPAKPSPKLTSSAFALKATLLLTVKAGSCLLRPLARVGTNRSLGKVLWGGLQLPEFLAVPTDVRGADEGK